MLWPMSIVEVVVSVLRDGGGQKIGESAICLEVGGEAVQSVWLSNSSMEMESLELLVI